MLIDHLIGEPQSNITPHPCLQNIHTCSSVSTSGLSYEFTLVTLKSLVGMNIPCTYHTNDPNYAKKISHGGKVGHIYVDMDRSKEEAPMDWSFIAETNNTCENFVKISSTNLLRSPGWFSENLFNSSNLDSWWKTVSFHDTLILSSS